MKLDFDIQCPNCGRKFKQRVEEMRPGRTRNCPGCRLPIEFTGDDGARTQRALDDFTRKLKNLKLNLKIKL